MTKILNIDAYVPPQRRVTWKGKTYDVKELNTAGYIANLRASEALVGLEGIDAIERALRMAVEAVQTSVPDFPKADLEEMAVETVAKIVEFVRGDFDPDAPATPADAASASSQEDPAAKK